MKALTVCQPYAELIARGEKPIENRTWPTLASACSSPRERHRGATSMAEEHKHCHDLVCNGNRSFPRGAYGHGCSCVSRATRDALKLAQVTQERDIAVLNLKSILAFEEKKAASAEEANAIAPATKRAERAEQERDEAIRKQFAPLELAAFMAFIRDVDISNTMEQARAALVERALRAEQERDALRKTWMNLLRRAEHTEAQCATIRTALEQLPRYEVAEFDDMVIRWPDVEALLTAPPQDPQPATEPPHWTMHATHDGTVAAHSSTGEVVDAEMCQWIQVVSPLVAADRTEPT